jgi:hypothetical protein
MKMGSLLRSGFIFAITVAACDYGSSTITGAPGPTASPGININGPEWGATVMIGADNLIPVSFTVSNFMLALPGTCAGAAGCGHVHLKVDGAACNNVAAGKPYNAAGYASPITADLSFCPAAEGQHDISLELHHDDHTPVLDDKGVVIGASSQVAVQRNQTQAAPTIAISAPMANATVTMAAGQTVPVTFSVSNFVLKAPGTCVAADGACGHVHVRVDGMACNNVAANKPYNNACWSSPIDAILSFCPTAAGTHTIVLELHNNDHTPVLDGSGQVVSSSVGILAQ